MHNLLACMLDRAVAGELPTDEEASALVEAPLERLLPVAEQLTLDGFGTTVTYSRKVFIPLTQLCRDVCHYCTFAKPPRQLDAPYLSLEQVARLATLGEQAGCREALFTLGDQPERRYAAARRALEGLGHSTTLEYLESAARLVLERTSLLPHLNAGVMTEEQMRALRAVSVSMGLMLETGATRLSARGHPHWGSPDKLPERRYATLETAGQLQVPTTTGLLVGLGDTRAERVDALLRLRRLHARYGHLQELIIQNFQPKPGTRMASQPPAPLEEQLWTLAIARVLFGGGMSLQAPPNLRPRDLALLLRSGANDWGGVSPVTPDHVNPEAPWPHLDVLAAATAAAGRELRERLAIAPAHAAAAQKWVAASLSARVRQQIDARGHARTDSWIAGTGQPVPAAAQTWLADARTATPRTRAVDEALSCLDAGATLDSRQLLALLRADGADLSAVLGAADRLRARAVGDAVSYVVNRNINYTNICTYRCGFCAFSKGRSARSLRGPGYLLDLDEIVRRAEEAWRLGATEVCLQGGIHPSFDGHTYLSIVRAIKSALPDIHVHAFSPLEVTHGARTLGRSLDDYLRELRDAGLGSLPGTAAEILSDDVRHVICPDKLTTEEWLDVVERAHRIGLRTTATIMFGHVEEARHWAVHLQKLRELQVRTGGFTEFVPLPFVPMETPMARSSPVRRGPTFREVLLMHAVARLYLYPVFTHIQASWVKLGLDGMQACMQCGVDDMGGTLIDESITRAAGGTNGQYVSAAQFHEIAIALQRAVSQRTTLYGRVGRRASADRPHACSAVEHDRGMPRVAGDCSIQAGAR